MDKPPEQLLPGPGEQGGPIELPGPDAADGRVGPVVEHGAAARIGAEFDEIQPRPAVGDRRASRTRQTSPARGCREHGVRLHGTEQNAVVIRGAAGDLDKKGLLILDEIQDIKSLKIRCPNR